MRIERRKETMKGRKERVENEDNSSRERRQRKGGNKN